MSPNVSRYSGSDRSFFQASGLSLVDGANPGSASQFNSERSLQTSARSSAQPSARSLLGYRTLRTQRAQWMLT